MRRMPGFVTRRYTVVDSQSPDYMQVIRDNVSALVGAHAARQELRDFIDAHEMHGVVLTALIQSMSVYEREIRSLWRKLHNEIPDIAQCFTANETVDILRLLHKVSLDIAV